MQKGNLIGRGRTAEIYEWGEHQVIKLFYDWYSKDWVQWDLKAETVISNTEIVAPKMHGLIEMDNRSGFIYDRIHGESMLSFLLKEPFKLNHYGKELSRVHHEIHQCSAEGLLKTKDKMNHGIQQSPFLTEDQKEQILIYMNNLPDGNKVCHGDYHPDNIMKTKDGYMVIDWVTASSGNPLCDVARTWLMIQSPYIPASLPWMMKIMQKIMKKILLRTYLRHYKKISGLSLAGLKDWILPLAAIRLEERVPGEEEWLRGLIDIEMKRIQKV